MKEKVLSLRRIKEGVSETTVVFKSVIFIFSFLLPVPSLWIWLPTWGWARLPPRWTKHYTPSSMPAAAVAIKTLFFRIINTKDIWGRDFNNFEYNHRHFLYVNKWPSIFFVIHQEGHDMTFFFFDMSLWIKNICNDYCT